VIEGSEMALNMPAQLTERARELAEGGPWVPPEARPAATVVLLRDGTAGLDVLLMRRPGTMAFAPGMHVFPGGRVEPETDGLSRVTGTLPGGSWAPEPLARAIAVAAVRETFEEAGVLLAVDRHGRYPTPDGTWAADRSASELDGTFGQMLQRRHLHVDAALLVPIAHWITPEVESRRYDTRFLAAALPDGQEVRPHATETETAHWLAPDEALADHARGERPMLPPTVAVLRILAAAPTVADALDCARRTPISPLLPRPRIHGGVLKWELVHGYTGEVLAPSAQPAGSEERGIRP
jgi:8-oxo-dGTP pyrophosphatase MutT (NUDIX family)